jgi:hypothetical protein
LKPNYTKEYSDRIQLEQKIIKAKKISEFQTGSDKTYCKKEILITNLETQEELRFPSVVEASVSLGINKDTIRQALYNNTTFSKIYTVIYTNDVTLQLQTNL